MKKILVYVTILLVFTTMLFAQGKDWSEAEWGIGMAFRGASIPFSTEVKTVGSTVPMLFYEDNLIFLHGFDFGLKLYREEQWRFSFVGRRHFFDAPHEVQNAIQGDNIDFGIQARYLLRNNLFIDAEIMSDINIYNDIWRGNPSLNLRLSHKLKSTDFMFDSFLELKYKTGQYNTWYYGLNFVDVGGGIETSAGFFTSYHIISNVYLYGAGKVTLLDGNARDVDIKYDGGSISVNSDLHAEIYFGLGFSNNASEPRKKKLNNAGYWRLGQGFATPSTLANIIHFEAVPDTNNNKLTSIFYGHPLTDELFGLPLDVYLTPGFTWHWKSDVQPNSFELNIAIKLYYTIKWPIRWRLGAGEGMSWVNKIPYMEAHSMTEKKDYKPSNLMNYLDFSFDLNIGDIVGSKPLKQWWIGYYIHHRSSIFETAQHFGRISGGSNHHTIYIMWNY